MTIQSDPFESVRLNNKIEQETTQSQSNENDQFKDVRIKEAKGFPGIKEIGRHATRIGSRIAETIGGIPGDVHSLLQSGVFWGLEKLTGKKTPESLEKSMKNRRLPTSGELKELSEQVSGGYTKAQGPTEKVIDEYAQTTASLFGPMKFRKALGVALGSQLTKEGLKIAGVGEGAQEAGKLGTMLLMSVYNPGGAMKYASSQFQRAEALSRGASITSVPFEGHLRNLVHDLKKGVSTPGKEAIIRPAEQLIQKSLKGKILVHDLMSAKRDIHTLMGDPTILKREKKLFKLLGKEIDNAIKPYERLNPAFSKAYRPANEIYGAVMEGNKASNFIRKILGTKSVLGATLAEAALGHPEMILPTAGAAGAAVGSARAIDFFSRLKNSPELRKFYGKALVAAVHEDIGALRTYAEKIAKIMSGI